MLGRGAVGLRAEWWAALPCTQRCPVPGAGAPAWPQWGMSWCSAAWGCLAAHQECPVLASVNGTMVQHHGPHHCLKLSPAALLLSSCARVRLCLVVDRNSQDEDLAQLAERALSCPAQVLPLGLSTLSTWELRTILWMGN